MIAELTIHRSLLDLDSERGERSDEKFDLARSVFIVGVLFSPWAGMGVNVEFIFDLCARYRGIGLGSSDRWGMRSASA